MTDRYPTMTEFWERLDAREVEDDLREQLHRRSERDSGHVYRIGDQATLVAVVERVLPGAAVPSEVLAQFVDETFDRQMGRGDERVGLLPRAELLPAGLALLEAFGFASAPSETQDETLRQAEQGELRGPEGFDSAIWFSRLRELLLLGYASDPRGMQEMGFPGPSYRPGYLWLNWAGPTARARRRPGHRRM